MYSVYRKLSAFFFIVLLILPFLGSYCWLQWRIKAVRKEVKRSIIAGPDKEELVLLRFHKEETKSKLRWEHSKEFAYEGEMYDVVQKEQRGDSVFYRCWWDNEETKLSRQLSGLLSKNLGQDKQQEDSRAKLYKFLQSLYCSGNSVQPDAGLTCNLIHWKDEPALLANRPPSLLQPPESL